MNLQSVVTKARIRNAERLKALFRIRPRRSLMVWLTFGLLAPYVSHADWQAEQIADALRAAPPSVTQNAKIYAWKENGERVLVRNGDGPYTCVASGSYSLRVSKPPLPYPYDQALKRVCETWRECAKIAADAGLRVVWEFEPGFAFNKPSDIFRVLDGVNHDSFSTMFDTCHANMVAVHGARQPGERETVPGGIAELARKLKGKIGRLHLIDSDGSLHDNHTSTHPPFGEGNLDFDAIMPDIVAAGCPDDWWTIDLCFWPDAWAATARCKAGIDELAKKFG
jgi:hypothetical protein